MSRQLKKYRVCGMCRANTNARHPVCNLGYLRKLPKECFDGPYLHGEPVEKCPKPLTDQQLICITSKMKGEVGPGAG